MIGIDLGTTYSCASVLNETGALEIIKNTDNAATTPSAVLIEEDKKVLVGSSAKNRSKSYAAQKEGFYKGPEGKSGIVTETKRYIGTDKIYDIDGTEYTPTSISGLILRKIKEDVENAFNKKIDIAVITTPANFSHQQRQETLSAAKASGLKVQHIINEPTAAALAYAIDNKIDGTYAIYDFGGGTFDCTIVKIEGHDVEILGSDGVKKLGGTDLDQCLFGLVKKQYKEQMGKNLLRKKYSEVEAEENKIELSTSKFFEEYIDDATIKVTRKEFEDEIELLIGKSLLSFDDALKNASKKVGYEIEASDLTDVILVGGTSRVPAVQEAIKEKIGKKPKFYGNPDETVAKGAALYVALKNQDALNMNQKNVIQVLEIQEITNVYLGHLIRDGSLATSILKNFNIIEKGSRIPCKKKDLFQLNSWHLSALKNNERAWLRHQITESYTDESDKDNVEVVHVTETDLPTQKEIDYYDYRNIKFQATYSIDENQIFKSVVTHVESKKILYAKELSMKKGTLSGKSAPSDDLDEFNVS